jgi:hypothetical protein
MLRAVVVGSIKQGRVGENFPLPDVSLLTPVGRRSVMVQSDVRKKRRKL